MYFVYILQSVHLNRFYIGYTSDIAQRLEFHEKPEPRKFTNRAKDWEIYHIIECETKSQAVHIEAHLKKMKSKIYIENLKLYEELNLKLLDRYKDG